MSAVISANPEWLEVQSGNAPLVVSMPHTGTEIPGEIESRLSAPWLARKDADWYVDKLYDFAASLGATLIRTELSRTAIDCNRDPSGKSLYPGQNATELCPTTTFDGEPLHREGCEPDAAEIVRRRDLYFAPYHAAIATEIARLRNLYPRIVLFDAHSIRSRIPRLFDGELPQFNIGTNSGASCARELTSAVEAVCAKTGLSQVTNGRFKGGYTTRHYGAPDGGVHAIQLELAMRGYMEEPASVTPDNWPSRYDEAHAAPMRATLERILTACIRFASEEPE